jgi:hypothetical protein
MFGLFRKRSEINCLIEKRSEELQQRDAVFYEYASMFAANAIELSKNNSKFSSASYQEQALRCLKYLEEIISDDRVIPIDKTLGYDAVLYLKAFLCADDPKKKSEVRKNLDEHITGLGEIIEACSHGRANTYPVIVEWLFTLDTETAEQLLTTAAQSSR